MAQAAQSNNPFSSFFSRSPKSASVNNQAANKPPASNQQNTNANTNEIEGLGQNNNQNQNQQQSTNKGKKNSESPLDAFNVLFDNSNAGNADDAPPSLSFTPETLQSVVKSLKFSTDGLPPETLQFLQSQGESGKHTLALAEHLARQAYQNAIQHSAHLTDRFVGLRSDFDSKRLSPAIRKELVANSLKSNQNAQHPVVSAMLAMVGEQLAARHPDATPEWINEQTQLFLTSVGSALGGKNTEGQGNTTNDSVGDVDWGEWLANSKPPKQ